jgi:hypothetical protein
MSKQRNPIKDIIESKPIELKGAPTAPEPVDNTLDFQNVQYKKPTSLEEQAIKAVGSASTTGFDVHLSGATVMSGKMINQALQPLDIARAIPDPYEREAYINKHGKKLVNLVDLNKFAMTFQGDFQDLARYKEKNYHKAVKNFIDELDENEGWLAESQKTIQKLIGKTALNIAGILPSIYGVGSAIGNWDTAKLFDNKAFDLWEEADRFIDTYTFVYGGSDIWEIDPVTGGLQYDQNGQPTKKDFFVRAASDPTKVFNEEVAPAIAFIAGAVTTEVLAASMAPFTGGASLALNSARLAAKAESIFSKSYKVAKGLDKLQDTGKALGVLEDITNKYYKGTSTIMGALRSSSLENALVARSTSDGVFHNLVEQHTAANNGEAPDEAELARYKELANSAGVTAYAVNLPLVAGSNFIQIPKLYLRNWNMATTSARKNYQFLDRNSFRGTRFEGGKRIANVDSSEFGIQKYFGYTKAATKGFLSEGFEEFAQGALEEGLIDYYGSYYGAQGARDQASLIDSMINAGRKFANSDEGVSSISIGAAMGLLGLRLPTWTKTPEGKYKFKLQSFGGALSEIRELRGGKSRGLFRLPEYKAREDVEAYNKMREQENPMLIKNFQSHFRNRASQENADAATVANDAYEYKNSEHDQLFDIIYNRAELGIVDSLFQDIEQLKELPLAKFNEVYGSQEFQFTEQQRKAALNKAEVRAKQIIKNIDEVKALVNKNPNTIPEVAARFLYNIYADAKGKQLKAARVTPKEHSENLVKQLTYLKSVIDNSNEREEAILAKTDASKIGINLAALDEIAAEISGIKDKTVRAEFKDNADKKVKEILDDWKKSDPVNYNLYSNEVAADLQDVKDLKIRKAQASALYKALFTKEGQKHFARFTALLKEKHAEAMGEKILEIIKEAAKNTKNSRLLTLAQEEEILFGNSDNVDTVAHINIIKGIDEYKKIKKEDVKNLSNNDKKEFIRFLDKYPGLLSAVVRELKSRGFDVPGIKSVDDIIQLSEIDEGILDATIDSLENILGLINKFETLSINKPIFEDIEDDSQPALEGSDISTVVSSEYEKVVKVTEESDGLIILRLNDKALDENHNPEFGPDGRPFDHKLREKELDSGVINSPEFLSDKDLRLNVREATFEIPNTEYNNKETTDVSNMEIRAYYTEETTGTKYFIGKLPSSKTEGALLNLRKAILNEHNMKGLKKETEVDFEAIQKQIAELEKELQNLETQSPVSEDLEILNIMRNKLKEEKSLNLSSEQIDKLSIEEMGEMIKNICKK